MADQCDGCKFMRQRAYGEQTVMECRFEAPRQLGTKAMWAQVEATDWCGNWEAAPVQTSVGD